MYLHHIHTHNFFDTHISDSITHFTNKLPNYFSLHTSQCLPNTRTPTSTRSPRRLSRISAAIALPRATTLVFPVCLLYQLITQKHRLTLLLHSHRIRRRHRKRRGQVPRRRSKIRLRCQRRWQQPRDSARRGWFHQGQRSTYQGGWLCSRRCRRTWGEESDLYQQQRWWWLHPGEHQELGWLMHEDAGKRLIETLPLNEWNEMIQKRNHEIKESECCCEDLTIFLLHSFLLHPLLTSLIPTFCFAPCCSHVLLSRMHCFCLSSLTIPFAHESSVLLTPSIYSRKNPDHMWVYMYWHSVYQKQSNWSAELIIPRSTYRNPA